MNADEKVVAPLVVDYYRWLSGNGGRSSDELLSFPLTLPQRRLLLKGMDDVNLLFAITSPVARGLGVQPLPVQRRGM